MRWFKYLLLIPLLPLLLTAAYTWLPVPATPLMVIRLAQGYGWHKTWVPIESISPHMARAVIAAEDNLFCQHEGFDWKAINKAYEKMKRNRSTRGASTISQQVAKNLFLWPAHSWLRKGLEVPLTALIESVWPKQRILEIYLNIAEFGPGIYGVDAAAQRHFNTTAKKLTRKQAALLAAVLPNPLHWSPTRSGPYVKQRASLINRRTQQLGPLLDCIK